MRHILLFALILASTTQALGDNDNWGVSYKYKDQKYSEKLVPNMASLRSQDSVGICYAVSASVLLNTENCRKKGIKDCKALPADQSISSLGVARYSDPKDAQVFADQGFRRMKLTEGSAYGVLKAVTRMGGAPAEGCISLDQVLSKLGNSNNEKEREDEIKTAQQKVWDKLRDTYMKMKDPSCSKCTSDIYSTAKEVNEDLNLSEPIDQGKMMSSFSKDSLDIALNSLLYPKKCSDNLVEFDRSMKVKVYPEKDYGLDKVNQNKGYEAFVTKMKEVMGGEVPHPVIMGFCALDKPTKACQDGQHAVVLAGYREYCDDGKPKKCKYEVKAGNSWGESWQKGHNDGWIDAKTLFDRTFYGEASMLWLED